MDRALREAFVRLAHLLETRLAELRTRGRTRRTDPLNGLAIEPGDAEGILAELAAAPRTMPHVDTGLSIGVPTFDHAAEVYGLSAIERDVLLLALAPEVDARFCRLFGFLNDSVVAFRPTVGLAMSIVSPAAPERCLATLLPTGTLHRLGLIATEGDAPLAGQPIRIPVDIWPRLAGIASTAPDPSGPRLDTLVLAPVAWDQVTAARQALRSARSSTLVAVHGAHGRETVARALAAELGDPVVFDAAALDDPQTRARLIRDALWRRAAIVASPPGSTAGLAKLARDVALPIVASIDPEALPDLLRASDRTVYEIAIAALDTTGRRKMWSRHGLDESVGDVELIAARYRFDPGRIAAAMALARTRASSRAQDMTGDDVIEACRTIGAAGTGVGRLIHRVDTPFQGHELVVPTATQCELDLIEAAARNGHHQFGPGTLGHRIRGSGGFVSLFAGPPGTGKTMAAQIIARRLGLDLLRIDLSQVVNKYIGETEKHLDQVFRECEANGAILFFDEADALFGKRTEVQDAHDRYSNIETAFLLQRLEQHPGLAILATNLKQNLDNAFLRRLHFIVDFPLPSAAERRAIWAHHLDAALDLDFLSRFELSGGEIRNAVITAIILGAPGEPIAMQHLAIAISRELRKVGRLSQARDFEPYAPSVLGYLRDGLLPVPRSTIETVSTR